MIKKILILSFLSVFSILLSTCEQKTKYEQLLEQEYQKKANNDSLFLGYHFGMTRQEFFEHSWKLNRQGMVREGSSNQSVRYEINELKSRVKINFYPLFYQDSIYSMPVKYSYTGWAPWNRDLWADSLEKDVLKLYKERYGNQFVRLKHPEQGIPAFMMIDGNKRISIFQMNDNQTVAVEYVDLNVLNRIKKSESEE